MSKYNYWIPSTLTLLNLALGFTALLLNHPVYSLLFILVGCLFDIFDGILARMLKATSAFGKELDSLADIVTFGVAPAWLVYQHCLEHTVLNALLVTLLPIFSAIRLAKFNTDESQKTNFSGLPTPANGLFFASMPYLFITTSFSQVYLIPTLLFFCFLLVSPIRMFSFKDFKKGGPNTYFPLIFLILVVFGSFFLSLRIIPAGVLLYILLSVGYHWSIKATKKRNV